MAGTAITIQKKTSVSNPRNLSWPEIESEIINVFDRQDPVIDYWGVPVTKEHVAKYCATHRPRFQYLTGEVRRLSPDGGRVLEVGTAYGVVLFALRRMGYDVAGTDMAEGIDSYGIPLVRAGIPVKAWDLPKEAYPNGGASYDLVIASEVLEHLQVSLKTAVARLVTALRPGGWLVVTTPNVYKLGHLMMMMRGRNLAEAFPDEAAMKGDVVVDGRCHPREPTMMELREALEQNGLRGVSSRYFDYSSSNKRRLVGAVFPRLREACFVVGRKA